MLGNIPDKPPNHPILLGMIGEMRYESRVEFPKGYTPLLPANVDLTEKFAEYHAAYSSKDGILQSERRLLVKQREVPASDFESFKKFSKTVSDDHESYVGFQQSQGPVTASSFLEAIWNLPYSNNPEAAMAYDEARLQYKQGKTEAEIESLKRAVLSLLAPGCG
jgi:hypothetical protein